MKTLLIRSMPRLGRVLVFVAIFLGTTIGLRASQDCYDLTFPEMDAMLIGLYFKASANNRIEAEEQIEVLLSKWETSVKKDLIAREIPHLNTARFVKQVESLLQEICFLDEWSDLEEVRVSSWSLIELFHSLRSTLGRSSYPIDLLLDLKCQYDEINEMISDPFLSLREWYELEEAICLFDDTWEVYNGLDSECMLNHWPAFDIEKHLDSKTVLNDCLRNLMSELKTAYRNRLEQPCSDLGKSLQELILLYGEDSIEKVLGPVGQVFKN